MSATVVGMHPRQVEDDPRPPHDLDAEKAVLGAILVRGTLDDVEHLRPADFYRQAHRDIFTAMQALAAGGQPIDLITLQGQLGAKDLDRVGGPAYITNLTDGVPRSTNVSAYAEIVRDQATARRMLTTLERARDRLYREPGAAGNGLAGDLVRELEQVQEPAQHLRLVDDVEMIARPEPEPLITGMLSANALGGLYGPSGVGKTTLATYLGICVTTGHNCFGAPVPEPGNVVHVLGEGAGRFRARLAAAKRAQELDVDQPVGYFTLPEPIDLIDIGAVDHLIAVTRPVSPRLVMIDTVNRNMRGNESSTEDMTAFVAGCDRLRAALSCTVLLLHHTGWDDTRERGSSVLRAAADTWMSIRDKDGMLVLRCDKQRDLDHFSDIALRLAPAHGSVVIELDQSNGRELTDTEKAVLAVLAATGASKPDWAKAACSNVAADRSTVYRVIDRLVRERHVRRDGKVFRPVRGSR